LNELERDGTKPVTSFLSAGRLAEIACLLEVTARKPGNVHRFLDFTDLHFVDFLLSATAIAAPLDRAVEQSLGATILAAVEATREVVTTNTNLGMILLLAPLAAVRRTVELAEGVERVLAATTRDDAREAYRAIRLARPGGLGQVPEQDIAADPSVTLREAMTLAADRDQVGLQYANGFHQVLNEALPMIRTSLSDGQPLETAILTAFLGMLARHPDSLIVRKAGLEKARLVMTRAAEVLDAGWPEKPGSHGLLESFETWLRGCGGKLNPGTTADLITAALFAALRDGTIQLPRPAGPARWSRP
jgi:triphosphoribosyl-dephospho-CoA synthase